MSPSERSAGLLLFRSAQQLEIMLVHMGGPYWSNREDHAWSIPKGHCEPGERPIDAARREFLEELGHPAPEGPLIDLGQIRQNAGKLVRAWAIEGDMDISKVASNTFELEWPPRSGRMEIFPEVDRAGWFSTEQARRRLVTRQCEFIDRLILHLADRPLHL